MKTRACLVLASLLFASPAFADGPVEKDKPAASAKEDGPYTTGLQMQAGSSASFMFGSAAQDVKFSTVMANAEGMIGGYFDDHMGLMGGVRFGYGTALAGCEGCKTWSVRVPVRFEYAFRDRLHGWHIDSGIGLFNTVHLNASNGASTSLNEIVDLEIGMGYRIQHDRHSSIDLRLGLMAGEFMWTDAGSIPSDFRAPHGELAFSATYAFAP